MRVGIDYLPASTHAPGVGRYARELVRALSALEDCPGLVLYELGREQPLMGPSALGLGGARNVVRRRIRLPRRLFRALHAGLGLGVDRVLGGVDLVHHPLPPRLPVSHAREVLAVAELPAPGSPAEESLRRDAQRCSALVVFSTHARGEVSSRLEIDVELIHVVPVGCDHWVRDLGDANPAPHEPPQIVALGSLRDERHPLSLLAAVRALRRKHVLCRLLYVGSRGAGADHFLAELSKPSARDDVLWNQFATEAALPRIVASSAVLVHLSDAELTPVTPLEALALGVPVVASRLPAFEEALGGEARLVDPAERDDPAALAETIEQALGSAADEQARARRRAVAAPFTWEANARATLAVWRTVVDG